MQEAIAMALMDNTRNKSAPPCVNPGGCTGGPDNYQSHWVNSVLVRQPGLADVLDLQERQGHEHRRRCLGRSNDLLDA